MPSRKIESGSISYAPVELNLAMVMIWLSGCAIYLAAARTFLRKGPQSVTDLALLSAFAILTATCWLGMSVVAFGLGRSRRARFEPGAWLLFSLGIVLTSDLIVGALPATFPIPASTLRIASNSLAFSLPTLSRHLASVWKWLFVILVVIQPLPLLGDVLGLRSFSFVISMSRFMVALLAIAVTVIHRALNRSSHARVGWLHWTGVVCLVAWLSVLFVFESVL